jgi:hypothetical protein
MIALSIIYVGLSKKYYLSNKKRSPVGRDKPVVALAKTGVSGK